MKNIPIRSIRTVKNELNVSQNFSIREVHDLLAGKDLIQELHRHDFFYILIVKKGKGNHVIDFKPYTVSDNSIFFMRPGQVHELTLKAGSKGYLIEFKSDFYYPHDKLSSQLLNKVSHMNFCQLETEKFKKLLSIVTYIFDEFTNQQEGYTEVIKANLNIFFIELVRQRQNRKGVSDKVDPYNQEKLEEFLKLMETHISTHKEVSQYADLLNLSPYQLSAITKATLGKTCSTLISEYIILESKRYLLATSNQINQVAYYLGYEDVSYFIRFFKKHTGYTPEAFRQNFG